MGDSCFQEEMVFCQMRSPINAGGGPCKEEALPHTHQWRKKPHFCKLSPPMQKQFLPSEFSTYSFNEVINEGDLLF